MLVIVHETLGVSVAGGRQLLPGLERGVIGGGVDERDLGGEVANVAVAGVSHGADAVEVGALVDAAGGLEAKHVGLVGGGVARQHGQKRAPIEDLGERQAGGL